jgi:hypothetical protein
MRPQSPFAWALLAGAAVLVAAFVPVLWQLLQPAPTAPPPSRALLALPAPWQIDRDDNGTVRAFGLRLPGSTLADAKAIWGDELRVALIATRGQPAALEAYVERYSGGGVTGKLVLASDADAASVRRWQERAPRREVIDADAMRWGLHADDRAAALRTGVAGLSFLPANRLDAATLRARFGEPALTVVGDGQLLHWLYPARGLAIAHDAGSGRTVVQVVAAADFERRLQAPLAAASAPSR